MYSIKLYTDDGTLKKSFVVHNAYRFYKRIRELVKNGAMLISNESKLAELSEVAEQ